jgi:hypothetical protein
MRTTIEMPDGLYRRVKHAAVARGLPMRELVRQALERMLREPVAEHPTRDIEPPLIPSRKPGSIHLSPDQVHEILVREERAAYETNSGH